MNDIKLNVELPENVTSDFYSDVRPVVKSLCTLADTIIGSVNAVLSPVQIGAEIVKAKKEEFIKKVVNKTSSIPNDQLVSPNLAIVGPTLENAKYSYQDETLSDLYTSLLSASVDIQKQSLCYRAFLNVINQISPIEARLIKLLFKNTPRQYYPLATLKIQKGLGYGVVYENLSDIHFESLTELDISSIVSNIHRLGVIFIDNFNFVEPQAKYNYVTTSSTYVDYSRQLDTPLFFDKGSFHLTNFGLSFIETCIP